MTDVTFTSGAILARTFELLRGNMKMAAIVTVALTAASFLGGAVGVGAMIFAQYTIISGILSQADLMPDGYRIRRFWAILGVCVLSYLGMTLGLLFLIVPGILLAVRWVLCVPVLIGEETGVFEALQRSWQETSGRFWPIFLALLVIYLPVFVVLSITVGVVMAAGGKEPSFVVLVAMNGISTAFSVLGWHAAAAIYAMLRSGTRGVEEVFA